MLVVCGSTVLTTFGDKKSGGLLRVPPLFAMWRLPTLPLAQYHRRDGA